MRGIYSAVGGRKVFQAYLFVVLVLGLTAVYWIFAEPPDFRWVTGPLAAALIGTGFAVAWEDRAQTVVKRFIGTDNARTDDER